MRINGGVNDGAAAVNLDAKRIVGSDSPNGAFAGFSRYMYSFANGFSNPRIHVPDLQRMRRMPLNREFHREAGEYVKRM